MWEFLCHKDKGYLHKSVEKIAMMSEVLDMPGGKSPSADPRTSPHLPGQITLQNPRFKVRDCPQGHLI